MSHDVIGRLESCDLFFRMTQRRNKEALILLIYTGLCTESVCIVHQEVSRVICEDVILKTNYPKSVFHHVWYQSRGKAK